MSIQQVRANARKLVTSGKGILAADEGNTSVNKRLEIIGLANTMQNRRAFRDLLLTAKDAKKYLTGVILFDETLRQSALDCVPFVKHLQKNGIMVGIKVDAGLKPLAGFPGEEVTEGLDGLRERLAEYYKLGARFCKWRALIKIDGEKLPTQPCIDAYAHTLARYAALCQEQGFVPIVEPEVLIDGTHTLARSEYVLKQTLQAVFIELIKYRVDLAGCILKTSMAVPGNKSKKQNTHLEIAKATARVLRVSVPKNVAGVVFLSGGQKQGEATKNLQEIAKLGKFSWPVSYSFAREFQIDALKVWAGEKKNKTKAQEVFIKSLREAHLAQQGKLY